MPTGSPKRSIPECAKESMGYTHDVNGQAGRLQFQLKPSHGGCFWSRPLQKLHEVSLLLTQRRLWFRHYIRYLPSLKPIGLFAEGIQFTGNYACDSSHLFHLYTSGENQVCVDIVYAS